MTALAHGVGDDDQLSGDGGDDDLMRFSGLAEAICEGFQARVVMCRDQGCLEHHVPQGTTTTGDGPLSAKGSAVVRDRGQTSECGNLFASDGADLGHFCDQHCAGNRADPRDGAENTCGLRQAFIARFFAFRPEAGRSLPAEKLRLLRALTSKRSQLVEMRKRLLAQIRAHQKLGTAAMFEDVDTELKQRIDSLIKELEEPPVPPSTRKYGAACGAVSSPPAAGRSTPLAAGFSN